MAKSRFLQETDAFIDARISGTPLQSSSTYLNAFQSERARLDAQKEAQDAAWEAFRKARSRRATPQQHIPSPRPNVHYESGGGYSSSSSDGGVLGFFWALITLPFRIIALPFRLIAFLFWQAWYALVFLVRLSVRLALVLLAIFAVVTVIGALK